MWIPCPIFSHLVLLPQLKGKERKRQRENREKVTFGPGMNDELPRAADLRTDCSGVTGHVFLEVGGQGSQALSTELWTSSVIEYFFRWAQTGTRRS